MRLLPWLALLSAGCAAQMGTAPGGLPLEPTAKTPAPAAWKKVHVIGADTHYRGNTQLSRLPTEALAQAILARVHADSDASIGLTLTDVRIALGDDEGSRRLGLGADFVLRRGTEEQHVRLEHTVNLLGADEPEKASAYAAAVDGLLDQLFVNRDALTFLGDSAEATFTDSRLADGARQLGPVLATKKSADNVLGTGQTVWGNNEVESGGAVTIMFGDTKLITGFGQQRQAKVMPGLGTRLNAGFAMMPGQTTTPAPGVSSTSPTAFGFILGLGAEVGLLSTQRSAEGYVERPGISALLVPQITETLLFASQDAVRTTVTVLQAGAALELDLPLGNSGIGLSGRLFGGWTGSRVNYSGSGFSGSFSSPFAFAWVPGGDIYFQSASGRFSLGVALDTLASAAGAGSSQDASASITKNPKLTLTFSERNGRGLAYKSEDVSALGTSLYGNTQVTSRPRSAFLDDTGVPVVLAETAAPAVLLSLNDVPPPAEPKLAVREVAPDTRPRWVVLPVKASAALGLTAEQAARGLAEDVLKDSGRDCVARQTVSDVLSALGVSDVQVGEFADIAGAMQAGALLLIELSLDGDAVHYRLTRFIAKDGSTTVKDGTTTRLAMLRVLREALPGVLL